MTMSNASHDNQTMDPALLAKLTGGLGDRGRVAKLCSSFGDIYSEFFPDVLKSETGLDVTVGYLGCEIGYKNHLIDDLSTNMPVSRSIIFPSRTLPAIRTQTRLFCKEACTKRAISWQSHRRSPAKAVYAWEYQARPARRRALPFFS